MPQFLREYLESLSKTESEMIWDWADGDPGALEEIIDVVAPQSAVYFEEGVD